MLKFITVYAHCDLPCGEYDPNQARIEARSVLKILKKAKENKGNMYFTVRSIFIKEKVCEEIKKHINILHSDYFTAEHFKKYPSLHQHIHSCLQLARKVKASDDIENGENLLKEIDAIDEIFKSTKK